MSLLAEQIIGLCEGDAAGEDLDAIRNALASLGIPPVDVSRVMLAMRGMYQPGGDASAEDVQKHVHSPTPRTALCADEGCTHHGTPHACVDTKHISVDAKDLHSLLTACIGPPYLLREMEATRGLCKRTGTRNPLQALIDRYTQWFDALPTDVKKDTNEPQK